MTSTATTKYDMFNTLKENLFAFIAQRVPSFQAIAKNLSNESLILGLSVIAPNKNDTNALEQRFAPQIRKYIGEDYNKLTQEDKQKIGRYLCAMCEAIYV